MKHYLYPVPGEPTRLVSRQRIHQLKFPDRHRARQAVVVAVMSGHLPSPVTLACLDCGAKAVEYDHYLGYDQAHALDVQPVCRYCHTTRETNRRTECRRGHSYAEFGGWEQSKANTPRRVCLECARQQYAKSAVRSGKGRMNRLGLDVRPLSVTLTDTEHAAANELVVRGYAANHSQVVGRALLESLTRINS